jgi:hypothetical protein
MPQQERKILNKYPLSDTTAKRWPELASNLASLATSDKSKELVESTNKIKEMSWLGKLLSGNAHGMMNPITGTVSLNRDVINEDKVDLMSVLSHELKHAYQRDKAGILSLIYGNRDEQEKQAYSSEISSPIRRDIRLPLEGKQIDSRILRKREESNNGKFLRSAYK